MSKVSVIVPVYNNEKYLERCLSSIFNQTFNDIEIICVNDGSTDCSGDILNKYVTHTNFKIINQENAGLSEARNIGLKNALGDYISFIDSDDFIDVNFIETLYNAAVEQNADISCAGIIRENLKQHVKLITYKNIKSSIDTKEKFILSKCPQYNFVWNKLYKREFLIQNNIEFISGRIYEDMCFTPDAIEKSGLLVVCPNTFYHYWKHKNTLIKEESDKSRADKLLGAEYLRNKCKQYKINLNVKNELLYKEDVYLWDIPLLRKKEYRATCKYYLFGFIPFLEIKRSV